MAVITPPTVMAPLYTVVACRSRWLRRTAGRSDDAGKTADVLADAGRMADVLTDAGRMADALEDSRRTLNRVNNVGRVVQIKGFATPQKLSEHFKKHRAESASRVRANILQQLKSSLLVSQEVMFL